MTLNFVPDGKSKAMSTITHKLDAKETAKGKGERNAAANKAEAKKQQAEAAAGEPGEPGEEKKLSKKELSKLKKKEAKAKGKTEAAAEDKEEEKKEA